MQSREKWGEVTEATGPDQAGPCGPWKDVGSYSEEGGDLTLALTRSLGPVG